MSLIKSKNSTFYINITGANFQIYKGHFLLLPHPTKHTPQHKKREVTDHKGESLLWFRFQMFFKEDNSKGIPIKIKYTSVQSIAMRR